jgi:hypothetical protein
MKEAKKGIDMTKKETSVAKADTTIMDKQVDYTDEAAKKFDEKIGKELVQILVKAELLMLNLQKRQNNI